MKVGADRRARALLDRLAAISKSRDGSSAEPAMTEDHPLAKAVGMQRAAELLDGAVDARQTVARDRRKRIEQLSREGKRVREIAAALGLSHNYVVAVRMRLGVARKRRVTP